MEKRKITPKSIYFKITAQRVLLLLAAGVILGMTHSPKGYRKIVSATAHGWKEIERRALRRAIDRLYESKWINFKYNEKDKSNTIVVTREGKKVALNFKAHQMKIKPTKKWDGKWRVVTFDVPEKARYVRDGIRAALKRMEFFEYQKSVFIHPFECQDEVDFIIEFYEARPWVRFLIVESLDNEFHLLTHFKFS